MAPPAEAAADVSFENLDEEGWKRVNQDDARIVENLLSADNPGESQLELFNDPNHIIDQTEKAQDAIDYEDISDDELPEEEDAGAGNSFDGPGLTDDGGTSNDTDDLFGDAQDSSPLDTIHPAIRSSPHLLDQDGDQIMLMPGAGAGEASMDELRELNFGHDGDFDTAANQDPSIPAPADTAIDFVKQQWPAFRENAILNWNELLPPRRVEWTPKKPPKPPKPLIPSKLSLELEADQEKLFRVPGPAKISVRQRIKDAETKGLFCCEEPEPIEQAELDAFNVDAEIEAEPVGGFTMNDIAMVCDDWDSMINARDSLPTPPPEVPDKRLVKNEPDEDAAWDQMFLDDPPAKKKKAPIPHGLPQIPKNVAPNFDDFQAATAKLGKRVILDLNDPYLLIDDMEAERSAKRRKVQHKMVRMANGKFGRDLGQRFNFSNDKEYDALKENHANRVRATLATLSIDHSMPAQKLVWPYYRTKLGKSDPHSYHRPPLQTSKQALATVRFTKQSAKLSRKIQKSKRIKDAFATTGDLTLNDNSTAILFEYCEEIPTVLSNFGMGNRIINYYRRGKGVDDRPGKSELGDNVILHPEDRSPFAIFGKVDPGETVPTLYNHLYKAPIFKHASRGTDFLVGRSHTSSGPTWYLRNIDHMYVVGQNLPILDIPGPHSRKVSNISKNRLKMLCYRIMRQHQPVHLGNITRHVYDSNESQNRQKMKEFLQFRKETKDWVLPEGEELMEEAAIRQLVRPEEVCALDAMQVGVHELANSGFSVESIKGKEEEEQDLDDGAQEDLAKNMAPWRLTKNFIDACTGKAMLAVHGPGDPTGKGLGISFIKTSMKGGFLEQLRGPLATSADAIERERKANGGHMYNVKNQDLLYTGALLDIWRRQRESLEEIQEHADEDVQPREDEDDRFNSTQAIAAATPAFNDGVSQISRSAASGVSRKKLKITRTVRRPDGSTTTEAEIVYDPVVIAQYLKKRKQLDVDRIDVYNAQATGDAEKDRLLLEAIEAESQRLEKNVERRHKREKQKKLLKGVRDGGNGEGSPEPSTEKATGTTRKCANCGQVGHIKTNKKCVKCWKFEHPEAWSDADFEH